MAKVRYVELTADEPERALRFYANVFGWFAEKWQHPEDYWQLSGGEESEPGVNGAVRRRIDGAQGAVPMIDVEDVVAAIARVLEAGGTVVSGHEVVPHVGYTAYCLDTEGNAFGLIQFDETAAPEA
jgi:uncharacterized protein